MTVGTSRDDFLRIVRQALGKETKMGSDPHRPQPRTPLPRQRLNVDAILARLDAERPHLLKRFVEMAQVGGWHVTRVETHRQAGKRVAAIARELGVTSVVRSEEQVVHRVGMDAILQKAGVEVSVMAQTSGLSPESRRQVMAEAHLGITGVEYAIADTGTCVLLAGKGISRLVSLLPPAYIAIVEADKVVETIDDVLALRRLAYQRQRGGKGSYMSFVTGPSRSGDIEQTITVGVHGPGEVHCVVVG